MNVRNLVERRDTALGDTLNYRSAGYLELPTEYVRR
jgi:hypothetical protein